VSKHPNWTKEELKILEEAYPRLGRCKELQQLFPSRNLEAIALKANRMGYTVLNNIRKGRTNEEYLALLENTNFISLEPYKGSTTPIMHMCGICEYEWLTRPQHVLKEGASCPKCSTHGKLAIAEVDSVLKIAGFTRLSEYVGALQPILLKHNLCGYTWNTVYSYIQQGSGCPICNIGFGTKYSGENMPEKAFIYLFKVTTKTEIFLKIGITARPIHRREVELKSRIPNLVTLELLHYVEDTGLNILRKEKLVLATFKGYTPICKFEGSTELLPIECNHNNIIDIMNEKI